MAQVSIDKNLADVTGPGDVLIATDLHGHLADFEAIEALFRQRWAASTPERRPVLILAGDVVHGPSMGIDEWPAHLGDYYEDESPELFRRLARFHREFSSNVCVLLGNHDHAHIGGPLTATFHRDEAGYLESQLVGPAAAALRLYILSWPLVARTAGNVVVTHGAAPANPMSREDIQLLGRQGYENLSPMAFLRQAPLAQFLWRRGASVPQTHALIRSITGHRKGVHIHGHDVERSGYAWETPYELVVSTSFGLARANKTIVIVDNEATFSGGPAFEAAGCLHRLYPDAVTGPETSDGPANVD